MGSLATSDEDLMKIVAKSLQKKGLYFIDSLTSPRSIAYEVAREVGIPTAVRTVFLDNKREKSEIQAQFKKAIEVAKRSGRAIAIGHVNLQTLETFKEMIEQGFFSEVSFSFASEVVS
ncbi:MAG: divergent polysaccharide deacetylase family protein, partial [Candidatus Marinimicrobia bacterium]|nr:divergent polysaccharide deacetylase family protein [Candidatus Neomarinimicrobiota bacterium]